ncbi:MAG: GNAT family N-acetyltransferase [Chloroflexi bacterium]|nr:GNAT family N-acetyltransferase [Chloroflexota bacterium]
MAINARKELKDYQKLVTLKDGSRVRLRTVRADDEERLAGLFYRLSRSAVYLRFHHILVNLSRDEARRFASLDFKNTFAIVAATGDGTEENIVAVGRYSRLPKGDAAEVAFVVEDAYRGKGIGTHLVEQLAAIAHQEGIGVFEAEVMAENQEMMKVFRDSGFEFRQRLEEDVYRVTLTISPTPSLEEVSAERERLATVTSLKPLLAPRSIAVVGASRRPGSIGNKVFHNLLLQEFAGVVYPVNPNAASVASVKAYPSILDVPDEVDLAVIIVPAELVPEMADQCGRKGVRSTIVISSGFGESGPEGVARQKRLDDIHGSYGLRLVGPNCMGIINTDPGVNMNATFSAVFPAQGNIAFGTQSGALGLAILEYARGLNIGLSTFVSIGNMADVSGVDLLQYWEDDPATKVILLYQESFGDPRKFARVARRIARVKPIVALKSGRTAAGSRAAASHTGALATTEVAAEALFTQAGIIRVDTMEQLFDVANLLSHQPIPQGKRVAIVTNGGGPGILTADACAARGLELPPVPEGITAELRPILPAGSNLTNPVDMTAEATGDHYRRTLQLLAQDQGFDIIIVIFIPPVVTASETVAAAIREVSPAYRARGKTLLASFIGTRGAPPGLGSRDQGYVPAFNFPEATASALASVWTYGRWLRRPRGVIPELKGIDRGCASRTVSAASAAGGQQPLWLDAVSVVELLRCYGINAAPLRPAATEDEAVKIAGEAGYPVAVKLFSRTITHKTEAGGVFLDLQTPEAVRNAFSRIRERLAGAGEEFAGVIVQPMVRGGVEVIVGVTQDPAFGPLMMFGMGGVQAELFKDVNFRIHPLTNVDAAEMIRSVKAFQLLEGWRGAPPSDIEALEDLLLRVSAMVEDLPRISELDLNPVKVFEAGKGYVVVDARIMLA